MRNIDRVDRVKIEVNAKVFILIHKRLQMVESEAPTNLLEEHSRSSSIYGG